MASTGVKAEAESAAASAVPESTSPTPSITRPEAKTTKDNVNPLPEESTGIFGAPARPEQRPRGSISIIMAALSMASFLAALDVTIVTTALPSIAAELHASQAAYSWIGSAYLLSYSATVPIWAKTSDVFGRKIVLLTANIVFFVGNLVAGLANGTAMLIAGRTIQGAGGGGLVVLVTITIADLFSLRERGKYLGIVGMVWAVASAVGPSIGGALAQRTSWRWCFYLNLPCDGAAFLVLLFFLDVHNPRTNLWDGLGAIDWLGSLLIVGATLMLLLGLQFGDLTYPWESATVICLIVFSFIGFAVFFVVQWKWARYPLIPLRLFTREVVSVLGVTTAHGFAYIAASYFLPFYFQTVLGATPIQSAVWFLPLALVIAFLAVGTGITIQRTGRYLELIIAALVLEILGFGLFIDFPAYKSWPRIISFQIIAALGMGPNFQAPLIAIQSKVAGSDIAAATSLLSFVRNLSSGISVVIGGVIIQNMMRSHEAEFQQAGIPTSIINQLVSGGGSESSHLLDSLTDSQRSLVLSAETDSLSKIWIFYTCLLFLGLLSGLGIGRTNLSKEHVEHKTGLDAEEANRRAYSKKAVRHSTFDIRQEMDIANNRCPKVEYDGETKVRSETPMLGPPEDGNLSKFVNMVEAIEYHNLDRYQDVLGQLPVLQCYTHNVLAFALPENVARERIIQDLETAVETVKAKVPWLGGRVINEGKTKGNSGVYKVVAWPAPEKTIDVKDVSDQLPPYVELKRRKFPAPLCDPKLLAPCSCFPLPFVDSDEDPAYVVRVQASFIDGGVLIDFAAHHIMTDGIGLSQFSRLVAMAMGGEDFSDDLLHRANLDRRNLIPLLGPGEQLLDHSHNRRPTTIAPGAWWWKMISTARLRHNTKLTVATKSKFSRAADGRRVLGLPEEYMGDTVYNISTWLTLGELRDAPLSTIAAALRKRVDEHRSAYHVRSFATFVSREPDKSTITYVGAFDPETDVGSSSLLGTRAFDHFGPVLGTPDFVRRPVYPSPAPPPAAVPSILVLHPRNLDGDCDGVASLVDADLAMLNRDPRWSEYVEYIG
ncbi:hypothetical protein DV738_g1889, partial [Chaetothyriales sp. CBS 135597]